MRIIETWHQYCALGKTQDEVYCDIALATVLTPVSFCFEPKITICHFITRERSTCLQHTQCPYCAWFPHRQCKGYIGGMSFSQERELEAKLLPWQHHKRHNCVSFLKYHYWCQVSVTMPQNIQRYS